jgi:hypothetical protein
MLWYIDGFGGIPVTSMLDKDLISVLLYLIKTKWSGQCPQHTVGEQHKIRIAAATAVISATG